MISPFPPIEEPIKPLVRDTSVQSANNPEVRAINSFLISAMGKYSLIKLTIEKYILISLPFHDERIVINWLINRGFGTGWSGIVIESLLVMIYKNTNNFFQFELVYI